MKKLFLALFLILFLFNSCKKEEIESTIVFGTVSDYDSGDPINEVKMLFIIGRWGLYSQDEYLDSVYTDINGNYEINIPDSLLKKGQVETNYCIEARKEDYGFNSILLNESRIYRSDFKLKKY